MPELYLIAHRVRGEAAFDVATRMECPLCQGGLECVECDGLGFWWIVPTSGHRAYPWWAESLQFGYFTNLEENCFTLAGEMPPDWPDHYIHGPAPKVDILALLPAKPKPTMKRRFL